MTKLVGVVLLRLGHRIPRDARVTTHLCLTARALGAEGAIIADVVDKSLKATIDDVTARFGGNFEVSMGDSWKSVIANWNARGDDVVHLTAYGIPIQRVIDEIRASPRRKLVVVGAEKVPGEVYAMAKWNVAITNQPLSEVSALGIFLDWYYGHALDSAFPGAKLRIIPEDAGKRVEEKR